MTSINDLPPESLVHIFSFYIRSQGHRRFLKNIPWVCKRWSDLHSTPSLWNAIDFSSITRLSRQPWTYYQVKTLRERGLLASARLLELDDTYFCNESETTEILRHCHNLKELRARHISMVAMKMLAVQCPDIQKLDIRYGTTHVEDSLVPFLRVRGQNLTHLKLSCKDRNLISTIAKYCHSLEELLIDSKHSFPKVQLPIDELVIGCPKLRKFRVWKWDVVSSEVRHHEGFENMVEFAASEIDFGGLDLYSILKNSKHLESLEFTSCRNVVMSNLLNISSDKVNHIEIFDQNFDNCPPTFLEETVGKWRRTLTYLCFRGVKRDLTKVLEAYLNENQNPKLKVLDFKRSGPVKRKVLNEVIRACENLQRVFVYRPKYFRLRDRKEVEEYLNKLGY